VFASKNILIADASTYAALDLSASVEDNEGCVAGPVATLSEALHILDSVDLAGAIVDCEIDDASQLIVRLAAEGVPLVLQTSAPLPPALQNLVDRLPMLMRPVDPRTVIAALDNEIGKAKQFENTLVADHKQV
jgi:hypothetical protein